MSPLDMVHGPNDSPTLLSDHSGSILVGYPNEAKIADWPQRGPSVHGDLLESESQAIDGFEDETELMVCSAADDKW